MDSLYDEIDEKTATNKSSKLKLENKTPDIFQQILTEERFDKTGSYPA